MTVRKPLKTICNDFFLIKEMNKTLDLEKTTATTTTSVPKEDKQKSYVDTSE